MGKTSWFGFDSRVEFNEVGSPDFIGRHVSQPAGHAVTACAFSRDGRLLATGGSDHTILLWDAAPLTRRPAPWPGSTMRKAEDLWTDLASVDAGVAWQAIQRMTADPGRSVSVLARQLQPSPLPDTKRIQKLLGELGDNDFGVRDRATRELRRLEKSAEPELRKLQTNEMLEIEVRARVDRLLAELRRLPTEHIQALRGVTVLERIGTPEARQVLRTLARGGPGTWLTQEANAALQRLGEK